MKREIRKLWQSFKAAFIGFNYCVKNERNYRIHLAAVFYVLVFAALSEMSALEIAPLFLCFALVLTSEMFNTSIEAAIDLKVDAYHPLAKVAKDVAAGAVLISSVFSAAVGAAVFWQYIPLMWERLISNPAVLICIGATLPIWLLFISGGHKNR